MEEKIIEIGEYTIRVTLEAGVLEVVVLDALEEEIESIVISDQEDDFDFESDEDEVEDSGEGEGDEDGDSYCDEDNFD